MIIFLADTGDPLGQTSIALPPVLALSAAVVLILNLMHLSLPPHTDRAAVVWCAHLSISRWFEEETAKGERAWERSPSVEEAKINYWRWLSSVLQIKKNSNYPSHF
ncbi:hypothetical protein BaRGS_00038027 [Batillaria attramentaria]|uniref:Uncharacterized protein n=1 Tax=Batillaria attramentaria TaxID=370345 RepID=A0ABD0J766_9CAEN